MDDDLATQKLASLYFQNNNPMRLTLNDGTVIEGQRKDTTSRVAIFDTYKQQITLVPYANLSKIEYLKRHSLGSSWETM